jgi:hypothetical protein
MTRPASLPIYLIFAALLAAPGSALAIELSYGGHVQSDIRFRLIEKNMGGYWDPLTLPAGIERNQNQVRFRLGASAGRFAGVADIDFVWNPFYAEIQSISDLARYDQVSAYYLRANAAYLEATDLLPGLDLRVGQMIVNWGVGDQFNPTNNLNPNDLEDPLYFGRQLANLMVKADYNYKDWSISGVLVPLFKPAVLPRSAPLGLAASDRLPFVDPSLRYRVHAEKELTARLFSEAGLPDLRFPTVVERAIPVTPEASLSNMQFAFRLAGQLLEQDLALSYYFGRTDFPQPYLNYTTMKRGTICNPANPAECVSGLLATDTYLGFPRVQVLGLNMAGQLGWVSKLWKRLKPIGYRFELGVYFPQRATIALLQEQLNFGGLVQAAGEYDYAPGTPPVLARPEVMSSTPFAKWVLGLDYTFNRFVYANAMWVHGMVDEIGAGDFFHDGVAVRKGGAVVPAGKSMVDAILDIGVARNGTAYATEITHPRLGDYLVLGVDVKFLDDRGLFRLFTIWDLSGYTEDFWDPNTQQRVKRSHSLFSEDGFSATIYPELSYNFLNGLELGAGALLLLGKSYTKFGDPAAGGSLVFTRARFSY